MARAETILRSSWFLGAVAAIASWNVVFRWPLPGSDPSWAIGLYMAAQQGLLFGKELIITYGPLGFLSPMSPSSGGIAITADSGLSQLAFAYSAVLHLLLCVSLVWALRRRLHPGLAALIAFAAVAAFPAIERPNALTAIWCLALLAEPGSPLARRVVVFGGGGLAAMEALLRVITGPVILAMCLVTLAVQEERRRDLPAFAGTFAATVAVLWAAAGQSLGNVPDYISGSYQVVSGYSQAMAMAPAGAKWDLAAVAGLLSVALLAAAAYASAGGRRRQVASALVVGIAAFLAYKQGVVREDEAHLGILFATALALSLAIPWRPALRWVAIGVPAGLAALAAATTTPPLRASDLDPIDHADSFGAQVGTLFSAARRDRLAEDGRRAIMDLSLLDPAMVPLLQGHTVHADPSGASVIWAYGFDWHPLPSFDENSTYTSRLDRDNADALAAPDGPARVLRGGPAGYDPLSARTLDDRNPAWNPPAVSVVLLCRFRPLRTTPPWQVLERGPDRCGEERPLTSVETRYGEQVTVPRARPDEAVLARIHGAEVSGLERLRSLLFRASPRFVNVNGDAARYRLVPGTAEDGLIINVPPRFDFAEPLPFSLGARTIELTGVNGDLRVDFYALPLR